MTTDHQAHFNGDGTVVVEYSPDESTPTSIAIVRAIAAIEDVDPIDLECTLHDYVEAEALDRLTAHDGLGRLGVDFSVCGYRVRVDNSDTITVFEPD